MIVPGLRERLAKVHPAAILYGVIVILVLVTAVVTVVSIVKYTEVKKSEQEMMFLPLDDPTWGALQLSMEALRLSNALYVYQARKSDAVESQIRLRLDILYSRIQVMNEVFSRSLGSAYAKSAWSKLEGKGGSHNKAREDLDRITYYFERIDKNVPLLLDVEGRVDVDHIQKDIGLLVKRSSELASQINQASNQQDHDVREEFLKSLHEYQSALLLLIGSAFFVSIVSFFLFFNARRAEKKAAMFSRELQVSNEAKARFLSSMSHELRTPLNAIIGFTQLIGIKIEQGDIAGIKAYEDYILNSARQLLGLINQVLDLEKIESGNLDIVISRCHISEIVSSSIDLIAITAESAGVSIKTRLSGDDVIETDCARLQQILNNFLSNAVKYNDPGGQVEIYTEIGEGGESRICVADTGVGIPPEKRAFLFEAFNRLGREAGSVQGTGIGLNICRSIAHALGGEVGYKPNGEKGSIFWVSVPPASIGCL